MNRLPLPRALVLCLPLALGGQAVHADPLPAVWDLSLLNASDTDWETARKALLADSRTKKGLHRMPFLLHTAPQRRAITR